MPDVGEIVCRVGDEYLRTRETTPFQRKALWAMRDCRTEAMGSTRKVCEECGEEYSQYRSCKNRHCPRCQVSARTAWLEARKEELLPVPYFHVVFTVPEALNPIALYCPEVFYAALLRAAGRAIVDVGRSKLHALLGCLVVLHTWGQNLWLHPHAHCVVPGGGLSPDGRWIPLRNPAYLLPVKVLKRRFRTLLCEELRSAAKRGLLERLPKEYPPHVTIENAGAQEWVAYVKPPFGGPGQVLAYLSRYTHRVAISNRRIVTFADHKVTFQWRDYADSNRSKQMTVDALEFVRRFLLHILPDRFVRIRYFGFLGNGQRRRNIELLRRLIGQAAAELRLGEPIKSQTLCPACYAAAMTTTRPTHTGRPPPQEQAA